MRTRKLWNWKTTIKRYLSLFDAVFNVKSFTCSLEITFQGEMVCAHTVQLLCPFNSLKVYLTLSLKVYLTLSLKVVFLFKSFLIIMFVVYVKTLIYDTLVLNLINDLIIISHLSFSSNFRQVFCLGVLKFKYFFIFILDVDGNFSL